MKFNITYLRLAFLFSAVFFIWVKGFSQKEKDVNTFFKFLEEKNYSKAHLMFESSIILQFPEGKFIEAWEITLASLGELKQYKYKCIETNQKNSVYYYDVIFSNSSVIFKVISNEENNIIGFFVTQDSPCTSKYVLPKYTNTKAYSEKDTILKNNNLNIKSKIIIPKVTVSKIVCIILSGSGPQDIDSSIRANKPLKDLAVGLGSKGISSIRFDKRETNFSLDKDSITIDDEYKNNILSIISYLKTDRVFHEYKIFLIGHSLGGMITPRIANEVENIDGAILMAANFRPLEDLILEQTKYLLSIDSTTSTVDKNNCLEKLEVKLDYLKDSLSLNLNPTKLPLNIPASYWLSLKKYNLSNIINRKGIKKPMLVLWGEKDYLVRERDFNLYKNYFQNEKNKFISYPELNHIFIKSDNSMSPQEYSNFGNIPEYVIDDIIMWLKINN